MGFANVRAGTQKRLLHVCHFVLPSLPRWFVGFSDGSVFVFRTFDNNMVATLRPRPPPSATGLAARPTPRHPSASPRGLLLMPPSPPASIPLPAPCVAASLSLSRCFLLLSRRRCLSRCLLLMPHNRCPAACSFYRGVAVSLPLFPPSICNPTPTRDGCLLVALRRHGRLPAVVGTRAAA